MKSYFSSPSLERLQFWKDSHWIWSDVFHWQIAIPSQILINWPNFCHFSQIWMNSMSGKNSDLGPECNPGLDKILSWEYISSRKKWGDIFLRYYPKKISFGEKIFWNIFSEIIFSNPRIYFSNILSWVEEGIYFLKYLFAKWNDIFRQDISRK